MVLREGAVSEKLPHVARLSLGSCGEMMLAACKQTQMGAVCELTRAATGGAALPSQCRGLGDAPCARCCASDSPHGQASRVQEVVQLGCRMVCNPIDFEPLA